MGKRVCVVGAGPSGLTAVKTLRQAGLEATGFEMSPVVGGHWVIDNPNGRSAAYRSLRTNTTKAMSRFSDFGMPPDWPAYPSHEQVRAWLESYVDAFAFRDAIETSTTVTRAVPRAAGGWEVSLTGPDGAARTEVFDALVAASGSCWDAKLPAWPGAFDGAVLHAQDYRRIGNTGCELAAGGASARSWAGTPGAGRSTVRSCTNAQTKTPPARARGVSFALHGPAPRGGAKL